MRCLSLADTLRERGAQVSFVCRQLPGHMGEEILRQGFAVHLIETLVSPADDHLRWIRDTYAQDALATREYAKQNAADWIVVDHYALDSIWENMVHCQGVQIMVIDDLADRDHDCDLLLDQNLHPDPYGRYTGKVPHTCECLFGPRFALLGRQFADARARIGPKNGTVHHILLSFGGADATNETSKALRGIAQLARDHHLTIDVVLGSLNVHADKVRQLAHAISGARVHVNVRNMAELMVNADLSFGAGGMTTWERCCLGTPTVVTIVADNQLASVRELNRLGIVRCLGLAQVLTPDDYQEALQTARQEELAAMSWKGMALVDGLGCQRVAERMYEGSEGNDVYGTRSVAPSSGKRSAHHFDMAEFTKDS